MISSLCVFPFTVSICYLESYWLILAMCVVTQHLYHGNTSLCLIGSVKASLGHFIQSYKKRKNGNDLLTRYFDIPDIRKEFILKGDY